MTITERCEGGDEVEEVIACPVQKTWDLLKWGLMEKRYYFYHENLEKFAAHLVNLSIATQVKHSNHAYLFGVFYLGKQRKQIQLGNIKIKGRFTKKFNLVTETVRSLINVR